jgi:hypothetical protein
MIENVTEVMATTIAPNCANMIDISTCATVISNSVQEYVLPLGVVAIGALAGLLIISVLYIYQTQEMNLRKDYLRRQGLLNKYEDWKKDRKLGD